MKLTLVRKYGISWYKHDPIEGMSDFYLRRLLPPDIFNCRSGDDIVRKLVWSEILVGDKPFAMAIFLRGPWKSFQIQARFNDEEDYMDILGVLRAKFKDDVRISVYVKHTSDNETEHGHQPEDSSNSDQYLIFQEGLKIRKPSDVQCGGPLLCDVSILNADMLFNITVIADIPDDHEVIRKAQDISIPLRTNLKIFEEGLSSDAILIAGNGSEIKSHQNFLIASSAVFERMFASGMKESETRTT